VLGVKVRGGQVHPAPAGVPGGERENLAGVARAHPGRDDQDRVGAADDPDVGDQLHLAVRDDHEVAGDLRCPGDLDDGLGPVVFRHGTSPQPGAGGGLADVAITRMPFDRSGIGISVLRSDPVGVVVRADDPLARRDSVRLDELAGRRWFRLPDGTDPRWRAYWNGVTPGGQLRGGPVVRTVRECTQAVLWNGTIGLAPLSHALPDGLTAVRLDGMPRPAAWSSPGRARAPAR
jgi:hypothetical protein